MSENKIALSCTFLHAQNFSGKHARKPKTRLLVKSFGWLHPSNYGSKKISPCLSCNFVQEKGQKCKNSDANLYTKKQAVIVCLSSFFY